MSRTLLVETLLHIAGKGAIQPTKAEDSAFVQFSSGSTGDPKGVVLSHENLLTNNRKGLSSGGSPF